MDSNRIQGRGLGDQEMGLMEGKCTLSSEKSRSSTTEVYLFSKWMGFHSWSLFSEVEKWVENIGAWPKRKVISSF